MVEDVLEGWYSMKNMEETNDDDDDSALSKQDMEKNGYSNKFN